MNKRRLQFNSYQALMQTPRCPHHNVQEHEDNGSGGIIRDEDTRTLCFIGNIDWQQLANFHTALIDFLKKPKPITIFICSYGGFVSEATAIYDLIKTSSVPITTIGYGYLESGGLLIYLAGHKRLLLPQARFMFHWAVESGHSELDQDFLKRESGYLLPINQAIKKMIKENTKLSPNQINTFLHDFKTLSAEEAVRYGLAHEIVQTFQKYPQKSKQKRCAKKVIRSS